jgi:hypothetical protein
LIAFLDKICLGMLEFGCLVCIVYLLGKKVELIQKLIRDGIGRQCAFFPLRKESALAFAYHHQCWEFCYQEFIEKKLRRTWTIVRENLPGFFLVIPGPFWLS